MKITGLNNLIVRLTTILLLTTSLVGCFTDPNDFLFMRSEHYLSTGSSWGAFIVEPDGPTFTPVEKWDRDKALLYIYRPYSQWAAEEIQAPSVWINGKNRAVSLANNTYAWFELKPGRFDMKMLRGLWGIERLDDSHFGFLTDFVLEVKAGREYYLRYSEVTPAPIDKARGYIPVGDGPMQLIQKESAWPEITQAKFIVGDGGRQFAALPQEIPQEPEEELDVQLSKLVDNLFDWSIEI